MKFKDRLKSLRCERNLTQKELGEEIFVTRSAVAKWENGLGLPSSASYEALLDFFGIEKDELPLNEEEMKDIIKNRRVRFIKELLVWIFILALAIMPIILVHAVMNGYGFTSKMAAGEVFADNECIETRDYDFYISSNLKIINENGEPESAINGIRVVEKKLYGYQMYSRDNHPECKRDVYSKDGKKLGMLYTFKGRDCYYHFYISYIQYIADFEKEEIIRTDYYILNEVYVNGERLQLTYHSYFITDENIDSFTTQDLEVTIKPYEK